MVLETVLTLIGTVATNPFSFIFALMMNFILIFGIFCLNWCSLYLADLTKAVEQKRTGGRNQNELELNSFVRP
jgi:ABC-type transport system involved in cytochrome bd biosynthesis fused ATPase/permease subunit